MSEVKTMSSIQFPNTEQPYQVEDRRIPANPGAYQQMVTNGAGEWGAEDRLAYEETKFTEFFPEQSVTDEYVHEHPESLANNHSIQGEDYGGTWNGDVFELNNKYHVYLNGTQYTSTPKQYMVVGSDEAYIYTVIGNPYLFKEAYEDNGEPFCVVTERHGSVIAFYWLAEYGATITVRIVEEAEIVKIIDPKFTKLIVDIQTIWNEETQSETLSANVPFEKIRDAYIAGKTVIAYLDRDDYGNDSGLFRLVSCNDYSVDFEGKDGEGNTTVISMDGQDYTYKTELPRLPPVSKEDAGKILQVNEWGSYELAENPVYATQSDNQKYTYPAKADVIEFAKKLIPLRLVVADGSNPYFGVRATTGYNIETNSGCSSIPYVLQVCGATYGNDVLRYDLSETEANEIKAAWGIDA